MCFMNDLSRQPLPPIHVMQDGSIDFEAYVRRARRERIVAQDEALQAFGRWLRAVLTSGAVARRSERLG